LSGASFVVDWQCCLGAGGEGEVYLGRALDTWELCAIKVSVQTDPVLAREELGRELARYQRAEGDGVVGLLAWNLDVDRPFLVFELARAGTLADEVTSLRRQGRVYHPVRALERIREVLCALGKVHDRGLVHRDVKPANLLRFGQRIKVADFGTAQSLGRPALGPGEAVLGTRHYAAPEATVEENVDPRADLYAIGCILHEMLTGELPTSSGASRPASYPNLLILPELDHLVLRLLDPDPAQRPRDATHAVALVDRVLASYKTARDVWTDLELGRCPY
jgi:eukaryotic-like serine/threonine-protein kinase